MICRDCDACVVIISRDHMLTRGVHLHTTHRQTCHLKSDPACPEHCKECEGSVCKVCDADYHLTEEEHLPYGVVSRCEKPCMDQCREPSCGDDPVTGGKICYDCYPGYFWDDALLACMPK